MTAALGLGSALGSAMAAATSTVLQHRGARTSARHENARTGLMGRLLMRPIWLAGLVAAAIGLVLHAVALAHGEIVVIQPLLVCGVVFALPVSVALEGHRPTGVEVLWALLLVAGLSVFLITGGAHGGRVSVDADTLALMSGAGVVAALAVVGAGRVAREHKALAFAVGAGIGYGVTAALLKQVVVLAGRGWLSEFSDWPIYALVLIGLGSLWLTQHAYHAGPLAQSMPALTITDPAVSVLIGALAFHEQLSDEPAAVVGQVLGFLAMLAATAALARLAQSTESAAAAGQSIAN